MTPEARRSWLGVGIGLLAGATMIVAAGALLIAIGLWPSGAIHHALDPRADHGSDTSHAGSSQAAHAGHPTNGGTAQPGTSAEAANSVTLSPERLQSIGVRFELAKPRSMERTIRTVGRVEIDERRLAHVNVK